MEMKIIDLDGGLKQISLVGKLDTVGAGSVETSFFAAVVPPARPVIVDLSQVEFIASMGLRMLLSAARSLKQKQVRLALYAPQDFVRSILETASIHKIIPVCSDASAAIAAVRD